MGLILLFVVSASSGICQNTRQDYSGKFGLYSGSDGLNNGLMIGADGSTEFLRYDFFLNLGAELYLKKTFNFFKDPKPEILQQQIVLIPISAGAAYKILDVEDADSKAYLGVGAGYYLYFYAVDYRATTGGILAFTQSESKSGGNFVATVFFRALIGKVFVEPKLYIASKKEDAVGPHPYVVNPSGFSIALGFQY
ncbi:MAG: hypothetical protein WEB33_06310 [Bacteroidota bacterium]